MVTNDVYHVTYNHKIHNILSGPKVIIYDNACNLHSYCLNREPTFFKNTWFLVDRFHWRNHKGMAFLYINLHAVLFLSYIACSTGYNMSAYKQFSSINSEVVEQSNSLIKRIKGSVSYMTAQNFITHVKLFFWYHNKQKM